MGSTFVSPVWVRRPYVRLDSILNVSTETERPRTRLYRYLHWLRSNRTTYRYT